MPKLRPGRGQFRESGKIPRIQRTKKVFFGLALVLFVAVVANVSIASYLKSSRQKQAQLSAALQSARSLLANAQSSVSYKDDITAASYLSQAVAQLPPAAKIPSGDKALYAQLEGQIQSLNQELEKVVQVSAVNLGSLGSGSSLITLPNFEAVQTGTDIVSFNKQTGAVTDGGLKASLPILAGVYLTDSQAAIYSDGGLYVWNFSTGQTCRFLPKTCLLRLILAVWRFIP